MLRKVNVINLEPKEEEPVVEQPNVVEQPAEITVEFDDFTKIKNEVVNEPVEDDVEPAPKKRAVRKKPTTDDEPKKRTIKK